VLLLCLKGHSRPCPQQKDNFSTEIFYPIGPYSALNTNKPPFSLSLFLSQRGEDEVSLLSDTTEFHFFFHLLSLSVSHKEEETQQQCPSLFFARKEQLFTHYISLN